MKTIIYVAIIFAILMSSCGSSDPVESVKVEVPKTPEQLKAELLDQEKREPLTYLTIDGTMKEDVIKTREEGLFRSAEYSTDGNIISGTIMNSATLAKFKDVVITVTFYSQTETAIESKDFTIYEFYSPNTTTPFELKVYPPEAMAKFGIAIKSATATD